MSTLIRFSAGRNKYDNTPKQLVVDDFDGLVEHMETNRGRKRGAIRMRSNGIWPSQRYSQIPT